MKRITAILFTFYIITTASSQTIGYKTVDVGGEFQWYSSGNIIGLHLAFNAMEHHSVQFRIGYNKADYKNWAEHDEEKGGGWGAGVGYRYYTNPFPHKFFIGARADLWRLEIDWKNNSPAASGVTKTWGLLPSLELGYFFWINDQAFITPGIAAGYMVHLKTDGAEIGKGFTTLLGISAGVRL